MTPAPPVLEYHHPDDQQLSLRHVTGDEDRHQRQVSVIRDDDDLEYRTAQETIDDTVAYLIYTTDAPEEALPDFDTETGLVEWLHERFTSDDLQVVLAVYRAYRGILEEKAETGDDLTLYKQMQLEKIPRIMERVEWGQPVPAVGAELLSGFILAHPMPNTNHRTGISLLDRYLTSINETFRMPETGEEGEWYPWVVDFIHGSKRLLTLRRKLPMFRYAAELGYRTVQRKEGITIDLTVIDLERTDAFEHYSERHLERTREFVDTLLEHADADALEDEIDDGKRAFVDRLRTDQ